MQQTTTKNPLRRSLAGLTLAMSLTAAPVGVAVAAPEPSVTPQRWQLDVEPGPLRLAVVTAMEPRFGPEGEVVGEIEVARAYYYMTLTVTNRSGDEVVFSPILELGADDGAMARSGRGVSQVVRDEILAAERNPLLKDQIEVVGSTLAQGREFAEDVLAVWPADNLQVDEVTVFMRGFSGETRWIVPPDGGEKIVLYKTLMLRHETPGDLVGRDDTPLRRVEHRWIMR